MSEEDSHDESNFVLLRDPGFWVAQVLACGLIVISGLVIWYVQSWVCDRPRGWCKASSGPELNQVRLYIPGRDQDSTNQNSRNRSMDTIW